MTPRINFSYGPSQFRSEVVRKLSIKKNELGMFTVFNGTPMSYTCLDVCTMNGRLVATFIIPTEFPEQMALTEATENAAAFVQGQCLYDAAKLAIDTMVREQFSKKSAETATKLLDEAIHDGAAIDAVESLVGKQA